MLSMESTRGSDILSESVVADCTKGILLVFYYECSMQHGSNVGQREGHPRARKEAMQSLLVWALLAIHANRKLPRVKHTANFKVLDQQLCGCKDEIEGFEEVGSVVF